MSVYDMVREFHEEFGLPVKDSPDWDFGKDDPEVLATGRRLLREEFDELDDTFDEGDLAHFAHEAADLVYVVYGRALSMGVNLDPVIREIHRANMSKETPRGYHGKPLKTGEFLIADVTTVLKFQDEDVR